MTGSLFLTHRLTQACVRTLQVIHLHSPCFVLASRLRQGEHFARCVWKCRIGNDGLLLLRTRAQACMHTLPSMADVFGKRWALPVCRVDGKIVTTRAIARLQEPDGSIGSTRSGVTLVGPATWPGRCKAKRAQDVS